MDCLFMADKMRRVLEETLNTEKPVAITVRLCADSFNFLQRMAETLKARRNDIVHDKISSVLVRSILSCFSFCDIAVDKEFGF